MPRPKGSKNKVFKQSDLKKEADRIIDEILASKGIVHNQSTYQVSDQVSDQVTSKVDAFLKDLEQEVADTNIPLDWQPIMNVLTRMYEAGEERYDNVKFYKSKGIIVTLDKKVYNDAQKELQRIIFNVGCGSLKYDVKEDDSKTVITITLA
jgi:wyosine [tRNA(Phe)-imidazoG37] synthetase (radical SAM superfamily)